MILPKDSSGRGIYFYNLHRHTHQRNLYDIGLSCADPGIFVRGGGGGSRSIWQKSSDNLFFSTQLNLQSQMVNFKENYHFSRFLRGSNIFQGGGSNFFRGGGFQLLIPIENIQLVIFRGRSGSPAPPPLWIRTWDCPWYYPFMQRMHQIWLIGT